MLEASEATLLERCETLGVSLKTVGELAASVRPAMDIAHVLGLDRASLRPLKPRNWLWMAAQTSSVSYRRGITGEELLRALTTGQVPEGAEAPMMHFLDESPLQIVVMAVEQASNQAATSISVLWRHVAKISSGLGCERFKAPSTENPSNNE
jgi:hypothetical protein